MFKSTLPIVCLAWVFMICGCWSGHDAAVDGDTLVGTWSSTEFSGPELGALESVIATFEATGEMRWVGTNSDGTERTQVFSYRIEGERLLFEAEHEESPVPYAYELQGDVLQMRALRHTAHFVFERVQQD